MKCVELFCGTKSFSKVARELGHETWTTDYDKQHNADYTGDIFNTINSGQKKLTKEVIVYE